MRWADDPGPVAQVLRRSAAGTQIQVVEGRRPDGFAIAGTLTAGLGLRAAGNRFDRVVLAGEVGVDRQRHREQHTFGRAAASTTHDIYGHVMPSDTDRLRVAVDLAFQSAEDSLRTPDSVSVLCPAVTTPVRDFTAKFGIAER